MKCKMPSTYTVEELAAIVATIYGQELSEIGRMPSYLDTRHGNRSDL